MCPCVPSGTMTRWTTVSFPALIRYCNPQLTSASSRLWRREEEAGRSRATLNPSAAEGHIRGPPNEPRRALSGQGSAQGLELLKVFLGRDLIWLNRPFATVNVTFKAPARARSSIMDYLRPVTQHVTAAPINPVWFGPMPAQGEISSRQVWETTDGTLVNPLLDEGEISRDSSTPRRAVTRKASESDYGRHERQHCDFMLTFMWLVLN